MFFVVRSNDSFSFPLGWIKYIVIITAGSLEVGQRQNVIFRGMRIVGCLLFVSFQSIQADQTEVESSLQTDTL